MKQNRFNMATRKKSYLTVTDQFCGAGGSSEGISQAMTEENIKGVEIALALNHDNLALSTHAANFPKAIHERTDMRTCDPRWYPSTDILITSPECTNHSVANGKKKHKEMLDLFDSVKIDPAEERSRATMFDVPRFAEHHNYRCIIVENVVDVYRWRLFEPWLKCMIALDYNWKIVSLNAMFCWPTPQSRDRVYIVFWKKGQPAPDLDIRPDAFCTKCCENVKAIQTWKNGNKVGKYKRQYYYRCPKCTTAVEPYYYAAFNAIDWSDLGTRIGDRTKELSPNTIKRIKYGLEKFKEPFTINEKPSTGISCRVKGAGEYLYTVDGSVRFGLTTPFIMKGENAANIGNGQMNVKGIDEAFPTQATRQTLAMCLPFLVDGNFDAKPSRAQSIEGAMDTLGTQNRTGLVLPFLIDLKNNGRAHEMGEALSTICASARHHALIVENKGESKSRTLMEALSTLTTKSYQGIFTSEAVNSFVSYYYKSHQSSHITDALNAMTAKDRAALVSNVDARIEDCYYRTLKPKEVKKAMAFRDDYVINGNGKEQVRQCGNAVAPPCLKELGGRVIKSLN